MRNLGHTYTKILSIISLKYKGNLDSYILFGKPTWGKGTKETQEQKHFLPTFRELTSPKHLGYALSVEMSN